MKGERAFKPTVNNGKTNENVLKKRNWPICLSLWISHFFCSNSLSSIYSYIGHCNIKMAEQ